MNSAPPEYPASWIRVVSMRCSAITLAASDRNQSPFASARLYQVRSAVGVTGTTRIMFLAAARAAMFLMTALVGRWA